MTTRPKICLKYQKKNAKTDHRVKPFFKASDTNKDYTFLLSLV